MSASTRRSPTGLPSTFTLEGREKNVPCYDAKAAALKMDAPLPEGWEIRQSKAGKDYLAPPRQPGFGGGGGGRREMSPSERSEIRAEVALKAAAEIAPHLTSPGLLENTLQCADLFYEWITKFSSGAAATSLPPAGTAGGAPASPPLSAPPAMTEGGTTGAVTGEGTASVPPSLSAEEFFGKPCECGGTIWKPAPVGGFSVCVGCLNAEKSKEVQL